MKWHADLLKTRLLLASSVGALLLSLAGCSAGLDFLGRSFGFYQPRFEEMTTALTQGVMLPGYQRFADEAVALAQTLDKLQQSPSEAHLEQARQAWKATARSWLLTEAYQFGPVSDQRLNARIEYWPRRPADIEKQLQSTEPLQAEQMGATRRGLPALEYLLFGAGSASLSTAAGQRRQQYAQVLAADLQQQAEHLLQQWQTEYATHHQADSSARNMLLNQWVFLLETSRNKRLGAPAGLLDSQEHGLQLLEAPDCRCSKLLLEAALEGFAQSFWGAEGQLGMDDSLVGLGARPVLDKITASYQRARTQLAALPEFDAQNLEQPPAAFEVLFQELGELLRLVKVDLANALNETVLFTANDGD